MRQIVSGFNYSLIMKKLFRVWLGAAGIGAGVYWGLLSSQERQNIYGAYLSVVSSLRTAWIVYESYHDYQKSLDGIPYNSQEYHDTRHQVHFRVANRILKLSKENRGIYLKLGQYLGNLERVVPWEFTQVLKVLQDSAPPVDYQEMKAIFENDLHKHSSELFSYIDQKPIASASLAQVHKAKLANSGQEVAIKLQYPFLRIQSKWDLIMLKQLTKVCNYLIRKWKNNEFDFIKLYDEWTSTLVQELDFSIEVQHALRTKKLFQGNDKIYIPHYYTELCSDRLIVMQFVQGIKVNQIEEMKKGGINTKLVGKNLLDIFTTMIFKHGFVHCDAHPGNFLIRPKNNSLGHEIVLLDHGLYRSLQSETIQNFSGLFLSLMLQQKQKVNEYALKLNIHKHFEYLPLIFLYRSRNSKKKIGAGITEEERAQFREKDLSNFDSINRILQDLPPELMYIIRASNLIAAHNLSLGGSNRDRLFLFARQSLQYLCDYLSILYPNWVNYYWNYFLMVTKVWFFEHLPNVYKLLYGTL